MAYVFRNYKGGTSPDSIKCWTGTSVKLDRTRIATIPDSLEGDIAKAGSSVPSPFARMYLFDTAFKMVANPPEEARGKITMYHELVSHCLDLLQLLFQAGQSRDITFRIWDKNEQLRKLEEDKPNDHPHRVWAKALSLELEGPFQGISQFTLIYYKDILIGGTSPLTLVFTSPNLIRGLYNKREEPKSPTGQPYFNAYIPLAERDPAFISYLYHYYQEYKRYLSADMVEFFKGAFQGPAEKSVDKTKSMDSYELIYAKSSYPLEAAPRLPLYKVRPDGVQIDIEKNSDFVMETTQKHYKIENKDGQSIPVREPLALISEMNEPGVYTPNSRWNPRTKIRPSELNDLAEGGLLSDRFLPGVDHVQYPFVTVSDFLEDKLVKLPFTVNGEKFFTGFKGDIDFLLPIRKEYFNFFGIDDLKRHFSMRIDPRREGKFLVAELQIPLKNRRTLLFSKEYEIGDVHGQDLPESTIISNFQGNMAFFPFYQIRSQDTKLMQLNEYTVLVADRTSDGYDFSPAQTVKFYQYEQINSRKPISVEVPKARTSKGALPASYHYKVNSLFDLIEFRLSRSGLTYRGLIVPEFKKIGDNAYKKFTFSIDFGTSNTHIAYTSDIDSKEPLPFTITEEDMQMIMLNKPGEGEGYEQRYNLGFGNLPQFNTLVRREFIPALFGKEKGTESPFAFPLRTAVCEKTGFIDAGDNNIFTNLNAGFNIDLESGDVSGVNNYITNLKWMLEDAQAVKDPKSAARVSVFFESLLLMIRNKVILNQGKISDLTINWSAPLSMRLSNQERLIEEWEKAVKRVFKTTNVFVSEPIEESLAPYFYLVEKGIRSFADVANVDIGGGTTDVMLFMNSRKKYLNTSFRFAGNDIWGDGVRNNRKDNGFIQNFDYYRLKITKVPHPADAIYSAFKAKKELTSEDVISLLFKYNEHFRFTNSINDGLPELKVILYIHYGAIIYHLTQLLEKNDLPIPRYLSFTGRGSQYLNMLCTRPRLTVFTKYLFKAFTERPIPNDFKVELEDNPKEVTANGSVLYQNKPDNDQRKQDFKNRVSDCHWGTIADFEPNITHKRTLIQDVVNQQDLHNAVLLNVKQFIEKMFNDPDIIGFLSDYNIRDLKPYEEFLIGSDVTQNGILNDSFNEMLEQMRNSPKDQVIETFFFYPLKDALYELSKKIVNG
ncbi:hypothetical protein [Runella sp.]|uniref:hypothetical protein n=1 Tax=Runella sp. TaxID=1960881 RepID=UPI003D10E126